MSLALSGKSIDETEARVLRRGEEVKDFLYPSRNIVRGIKSGRLKWA
jgi:hypothetical protein